MYILQLKNVSGGDMSPRMWICQDTKKPTTRFLGTVNAIDYGIQKYNLDADSAYQEAYNFLKHQREINQGIYSCEDYFSQDLKEYWDKKYQKQIEKERGDLELLEIVLENLQNGYFDKNHCSGLCHLINSLHLDRKISIIEAESLVDLITKYRNEFAMNKKGLYFFSPHNKSYRIEFIQKIITTIIIDDTEEKITTEKKQSFFKLLKDKIMKKIITLISFLAILIINAQYTHSFKGYSRDDADEIQFSFIPLSISNDQEVNQFELGWRRGAHAALFRYGIDNDRTNYFDISSNVYFWITKHLDLTIGAGFGTRTNVKFEVKDSTDKFYIPYNFGIVLKPSSNFQIISRIEKIDNEHDWYFQTGLIVKFPF